MTEDDRRVVEIDERVKNSFERNGVNTLLLDIKIGVTQALVRIAHLEQRDNEARESRGIMHKKLDCVSTQLALTSAEVARLSPVVQVLNDERIEKRGARKLVERVKVVAGKSRMVWGLLAGGGGAAAWWHWPPWSWWNGSGH